MQSMKTGVAMFLFLLGEQNGKKQQLTDVTLIKGYLSSLICRISLVGAVSALILTQDCPQISV